LFDFRILNRADDYVVVGLKGDFAGERLTESVRERLEEHYVDDGVRRIRLNLGELRFIDLEGVAALLELRRESDERRKVFTVEGARGQVLDKMRVTGVLAFLEGGG
jgi:anti-anti-sigma factor